MGHISLLWRLGSMGGGKGEVYLESLLPVVI